MCWQLAKEGSLTHLDSGVGEACPDPIPRAGEGKGEGGEGRGDGVLTERGRYLP